MKTSAIVFLVLVTGLGFACSNGPEMVLVEGGGFVMGSSADEQTHFANEEAHPVSLSSFYMAKYEASQDDVLAVLGSTHASVEGENKRASDRNSFYDAIEYCNKMSLKNGLKPCYSYKDLGTDIATWPKDWNQSVHDNIVCDWDANGYRLPTEAEWEYAARGGKLSEGYRFAGSNDPLEVAWYGLNTQKRVMASGLKKPNELGLYDMSGNVWDFCWDWYDESYYQVSPEENPKGPAMNTDLSKARRVLRGGEWHMGQDPLRVSARYMMSPEKYYFSAGFRLVRKA